MCQNDIGTVGLKVGLDGAANVLEAERTNLIAWQELARTAQLDEVSRRLDEVATALTQAARTLTEAGEACAGESPGVTITPMEQKHRHGDHEHSHPHNHDHPHEH